MMVGMMKHRNKIKSAGFSLVEMAIVVTIMGVLAGGVLAVSSNKIEKTALRTTAQKINDVDDAIKAYYSRYGFIPCPASPTAQENTATFGFATNCAATVIAPSGTWEAGSGSDTIRGGVVPTRTLGLPDSAMYDEWGNRLSYAAIKAMTLTRTGYTTFTTSLTTGVIQMVDMNGNQLLDPSTKNIIPYVIISHGKDKKGAFGRKIAGMTPQVACGSVAKDSENCDFGDPNSNDAVFMDTSLSDSQTARDYFYDIVKWRATKALERDAHGVAKINDFISFPTVDGVSGGSIVDNGCLIKLDGTLWCWGENINGLLGNGTMTDAFRPIAVSGGGRWKKMPYISANAVHFCAIKVDDSLWCWGGNGTGALGNGTTTTSTVPVAVSGGGQWKSVHIRGGATCAIKSDSTLWCWGYNSVIPLGDGTTTDRYVPTQIAAGSTWKSLSISQYNMCGIKSDDTLWCWGSVVIGSGLGNGTAVGSLVPVQVSGTWKQVQPTLTHTCAIKSDDTLWCWGNNVNGAVGDGTNTNRLIPVQVSGGGTWKTIPTNTDHGEFSCAIKSDDTLWCWGKNTWNILGIGSSTNVNVPTQVSGGGNWSAIYFSKGSTAMMNNCALKTDATLWCWGWSAFGVKSSPTKVSSVVTWKKTENSWLNGCAKDSNDVLWCWGQGGSGGVGDGTGITRTAVTLVEIR